MFQGKTDWLNGCATVLAEMPGHGQTGDTKHGRYYWQSDALRLRVQPDGGLPREVRWKGNVPRQIVGSLQGRDLPVKVHPRKPDKLDFDWDGIVAGGLGSLSAAGAQVLSGLGMGGARIVLGQDSPASTDIADEIGKLAKLHEEGALTDEQFERAKQKLLGDD